MKLKTVPMAKIRPYERNPRKNDGAVDAVAESIRQCGYVAPIIVDEEFVILAGHTRHKALQKLGHATARVLIAEGLSEEQKRKYRLLDNRTNELAEWDEDLLAIELDGLDFEGFDFGLLDAAAPKPKAATEAVEDEFDEDAPTEPKVKRGEVWLLGQHRLMCGDAASAVDMQTLMGELLADMVFTDPPYNVASDSKNYAASASAAMKSLSESEWDKNFDITGSLQNLRAALSDDASVYICTSHFLASEIWAWMKKWADHYAYCVWSKPNPMPSLSKRHWTWNTELICYATKGKHVFNFPETGHALSTWTISKNQDGSRHPTEKPVAVSAMAISHSSAEGMTVLDAFGGSGSTLIACEQLNRRCRMMEINPHYCDVIIRRWEELTGKKAERFNV